MVGGLVDFPLSRGCGRKGCYDLNNEVCQLAAGNFTCTSQTAPFSGVPYSSWPILFFVDGSYEKCADLNTCDMCGKN